MSFNSLFGLGSHSADANLDGWWPLQDDAASTAVDDNLGVNDGTLTGGDNTADISATGPNNWLTKALNFDGTADHITTPVSCGNLTAFTILCRLNRDGGSNDAMVAATDHSDFGPYLRYNFASGFRDTGGSYRQVANPTIGTAAWHDLSLRYDGTTLYMELDGSPSTSATSAGYTTRDQLYKIARLNADYFDGKLCDVSVWSRALSTTELAEWEDGPEPVNSVAPAVSGTETEGQTLSCTTGTWGLPSPFSSGSNGTITYAYQWTRSNDGTGTGEADISGATSSTYTLTASDVGKYIRCRLRASNDGGADTAADTNSNFTGAIASSGTGFKLGGRRVLSMGM